MSCQLHAFKMHVASKNPKKVKQWIMSALLICLNEGLALSAST